MTISFTSDNTPTKGYLSPTVIYHLTYLCLSQCEAVNQAACDLAREVANEGDALVAGNICQLPSYLTGAGKEVCQAQFNRQLDVFIKNDVDFLIGEVCMATVLSLISTQFDSFISRPTGTEPKKR